MFKIEDIQKFGKEQIEAATATSATLTKDIQAIATEATDYSKKAAEAGSAVFEKLLGVKTADEAVKIQTEYAKSAYEGFVAQATKFGELYTAFAKNAYKPVEEAFAKVQAAAK